MSESKSADTVPGLGFKDKDKALETLKNLEGRDPDYQKLAIKGLIGRAKRTLTLTKAEDKVQNIKDALDVFENWLKDFEKLNLAKENRAYLPLSVIDTLLPLKTHYNIEDDAGEDFLEAYKAVEGDYKHLRTVSTGEEGETTWDIVRNNNLKTLIKTIDDGKVELWKDDLPTKEHVEVILWGYSPEAAKLKKTLPKIAEKVDKLGGKKEKATKRKVDEDDSESSNDEAQARAYSDSSSSEDENPKKRSKK